MRVEELNKIKTLSRASACKNASDYARRILLQKPVLVKYRNQSAEEILSAMIRLKNELNAIGNNFNQAVHKLHTLDKITEIKFWLLHSEPLKKELMQKAEEIRIRMIQIYQQWSSK